MKIPIETSARHIHLSPEALEKLFGKLYKLSIKSELSQPGQFSCNETVEIVGEKSSLKNVRVLGPLRAKTQIELSLTDCRNIGIVAPIRESGDLSDTPGCKIIGPQGEYILTNGVIIAKRHIHINPQNAKKLGLKNKQIVSVNVKTEQRSGTFNDVVIRVDEKFNPAMHIDTDEANAFGIKYKILGEIVL